MFKCLLHSCFLLVASTRAAILRAGLVELPSEVEDESAAGGIVGGEVAIAEDDGLGLVGIEEVDAAQVGSQRAQTTKRDIFLYAEAAYDAGLRDAEVVVLTLRGPIHVGTQSEIARQFDGVAPRSVEPRLAECGHFAFSSG